MRIRLSEAVDERLQSQAEALGMSPSVYATFLVAQTTLGQANAMTAMESAVKSAMQSQLDAMEPTGGESD
jgi:predicted transcriptional regulator